MRISDWSSDVCSSDLFHVSLREANVPSELVYYPDETHLFHQPLHRLSAMQENIDWFDFWLLGKEDDDPPKTGQYERWRNMQAKQGRGSDGTKDRKSDGWGRGR